MHRKTISEKSSNIYMFHGPKYAYASFTHSISEASRVFKTYLVCFCFPISLLFLWLATAFLYSHNFYCTYFKIVILEILRYQLLNILF